MKPTKPTKPPNTESSSLLSELEAELSPATLDALAQFQSSYEIEKPTTKDDRDEPDDDITPMERPDIKTLATLAAIVGQGMNMRPGEAVDYAWELWYESERVLHYAPTSRTARELWRAFNESKNRPLPKEYPVPGKLKDFLRLTVKAKTPADATKRLRDYFRYEATQEGKTNPEGEAVARIQEIKDADQKGGYFTMRRWRSLNGSYFLWWWQQKRVKARQSASKSIEARQSSKSRTRKA
jgi:hypothetical protein